MRRIKQELEPQNTASNNLSLAAVLCATAAYRDANLR